MAANSKTPIKLKQPSITRVKPSKTGTISKVRVIVRVRPFLPHEIHDSNNGNTHSCVSSLNDSSDEVSVLLKDHETSRHECYKLDSYFGGEDNSVGKIYEKDVKPLIPGVFNGCNATVFAYGATGSGKTYTMQGADNLPGLMPLAMSTVLSMCQTTGCIAEISYYEVYLDKCYDLLEIKAKEITVLDDKEGQIHLRGLSRVSVNSMSDFQEVFARGIQRRKVAHTCLNDVSSRSHGVLVITVSKPSDDGLGTRITGKLNLIDLAGNEDNKRSGNEGIRMQESAKINQSLFALSNVIYALNNNKSWVPYRESKLTRVLQDSLGGTSRALMVACLNPGDYQESVHTVSLAARSRHISNMIPSAQKQETPKTKIDMDSKLQAWLESKGKTKTSQSTLTFGSPFFIKTPGSVSSMKKQTMQKSSVMAKTAVMTKTANNGKSTVKNSLSVPQRKLFNTEAPEFSEHNICLQEGIKDRLSVTNDVQLAFENTHLSDLPGSLHGLPKMQSPFAEETIEGCIVDETVIRSTTCLPDEHLEEDKKIKTISGDHFHSPLCMPENIECQTPLRKAPSPINSNITRMPVKDTPSSDTVLPKVLLELNTPRTPFVATREKFVDFSTPLDKFNARSSSLKSCLAEEYIDFLNNATRNELVELKGIGEKRAEYIIELRETSPLKSLNDLEKIGLSSKQVQLMFTGAARGIFE